MSLSLLDDHYKHNLFIHHYNCDYFQTFHIHRNETINYKDLHLINFFKINNSYL